MFDIFKKNAKIVLADGTEFCGTSIGAKGTTIGEVVFTTSMTGYLETLTDASYFGQLVLQTFPLIGNYKINSTDYEGKKPNLFGYIVKDLCNNPSNSNNDENLNKWLLKNNIVAIKDIDTRSLTKKIRDNGVLNAAITTDLTQNKTSLLEKINSFEIKDSVENVSTKKAILINSNEKSAKNILIAVLDFGVKLSIIKNLKKYAKKIVVLPYNTTKKEIASLNPNGIVLSNGPGDPQKNKEIIKNLKEIVKLKIPMFGICLGHQLLALCFNAKTKKLKYGHRGANHPVLDLEKNRVLITSQNHGYCVDAESLNSSFAKITHLNLNDSTCEGISYLNHPIFSVQFHPEASPGPLDSTFLFERFFELIEKTKIKLI